MIENEIYRVMFWTLRCLFLPFSPLGTTVSPFLTARLPLMNLTTDKTAVKYAGGW